MSRWFEKHWKLAALAVFVAYCLVQAFVADARENCAAQCRPYAPEIKVGECYCRTDVVLPEAIPGED